MSKLRATQIMDRHLFADHKMIAGVMPRAVQHLVRRAANLATESGAPFDWTTFVVRFDVVTSDKGQAIPVLVAEVDSID